MRVSQPSPAVQSRKPVSHASSTQPRLTQIPVPFGKKHAMPQSPQCSASSVTSVSHTVAPSPSHSLFGSVQVETPQVPS